LEAVDAIYFGKGGKIMHKFVSFIILSALVFGFSGMLPAENTDRGVLLEGEYLGPASPKEPVQLKEDVPEGKEAAVVQLERYEDLPAIETNLIEKAAALDPADEIRVIIFLAYQPQDVTTSQVEAKYAEEKAAIKADGQVIKSKYIFSRNTGAATDSENYSEKIIGLSTADQMALREIHERNEALSLKIKDEIALVLKADIESYQQSVKEEIEWLGGTVEFGTIAGNAIVAVTPAGVLQQISMLEKVARVVEDRKMQQNLNNADDATKVNYSGGLWDNSYTGGLYDPAVLDSGTDLDHPALEDTTNRDNFYSWYLSAGFSDPCWNDVISEDDTNGHGTHVMGIVGSYGSAGWTDYLGMSYGVEKAVTLKGGFNNIYNPFIGCDGGASMYWSDAMWLVDRALHNTSQLMWGPAWQTGQFNDDVDGINLSYSGETTADETDYSRFWDSVVSSYPDLLVTISAGNSGPGNTLFNSPSCAYNPITVANVNDQNTADRDDDTIRASSTRGPTENGRRKPDIAAPGTYILSCNNDWESESDFISISGTSMSAPMVLGVGMDLMEAGVTDELEIKTLLINTAQKNEPGINFESDSDGWSTAYGWGYMNAWAAYYHRADVDSYTVTERDTAGDYILLSGQMRDEGSGGEGRDRVTMVWNRHATYNPHNFPTTYYGLSDLNLRLYREADNYLTDSDFDVDDNVHQVRINSGALTTDVVVKAYAWSTDFAHGGTTETFALATEENFVEVDLPANFQAWGDYPTEMEPNEEKAFEWWMDNESDIASHSNQFDLVLPTGWTRVSGADPHMAGSVAAGNTSSRASWILRAQAAPQDGVHVNVDHTHNSYAEAWGPHRWYMPVNVRWDTTPPSPNPMTWSTEPYQTSTSAISMQATTAYDLHGPVEYYFWVNDVTGGGGATHSGYQTSTFYTDTGLGTNHQYSFYVLARDNATTPNNTLWSSASPEYTNIETPTGITFGSVGSTYIYARSTNTPSGLTRGMSGLLINNLTASISSGWKQNNNYWFNSGLSPNTNYQFAARAKNGDGDMTFYSSGYYKRTLAALPGAAAFTNITQTSIQANWTSNGNPAGTQYFCENTTTGQNSGWITATFWNNTGLSSDSTYAYHVKARNGDLVESGWTNLGSETTLTSLPPCEGDFDGGGIVDWSDLAVFAPDFGRTDCAAGPPCEGDFNGDNDVDGSDLAVFEADFGRIDCP
jgi:Subtilase family